MKPITTSVFTFSDLIEGGFLYVDKTAAGVFVFEFKLNGTADEALAQIRQKRYFEPCLGDGRPVMLVGVEFSRETRNIGEHRIEPLDATIPPADDRVHEPDSGFAAATAAAAPDAREIARRMQAKGIDPAIIAEATGWGSV